MAVELHPRGEGFIADLIPFNRRMLEDWMYRERKRELEEKTLMK